MKTYISDSYNLNKLLLNYLLLFQKGNLFSISHYLINLNI